jgi:hypothetical protein
MDNIVKFDKYGNIVEVTESNREDITKWETLAQEAAIEAIHNMHKKGIATVHADKNGIFYIQPNGSTTKEDL